MQLIKTLLCALALCTLAGTAGAAGAEPKSGVDFLTLPVAQNTDAGKKVEVTEFFAYYCPHCAAFEPHLADWVTRHAGDVVFRRVHVTNGARVEPQQRLFYTLEAMGLLDQYHSKVFAAMHKEHVKLDSDDKVLAWAEQAGIDRVRFLATYRSFGVNAKLSRTESLMRAYKVDSWPLIAVDGRFITSPSQAHEGDPTGQSEADQQKAALRVMDWLVAQAKAEKK